MTNVYLYRGEQYDPDLSLYYLRARYFNPLSGRFMTRDPYQACGCRGCGCGTCATDPTTLHKYLYAAVDSLNKLDPTGRVAAVENTLLLRSIALSVVVVAVYEARTHAFGNLLSATAVSTGGVWEQALCYLQFAKDLAECTQFAVVPGFSYGACVAAARKRLKS